MINGFVEGNTATNGTAPNFALTNEANGYKIIRITDSPAETKILPLKSDKILTPNTTLEIFGLGGAGTNGVRPPPPAAVDFEGCGSIAINNATIDCTVEYDAVINKDINDTNCINAGL